MTNRTLRERLSAGEEIIGLSINFRSTQVVEMAALAGFDHVSFDAEHGPLDMADIEAMLLAADARSMPAIARPPNSQPDTILRFMDLGLAGLMVSQVDTAEAAKHVVDAVRYPPLGRRSLGLVRANQWGRISPETYTAQVNRDAITIGLVESVEAVDRIDDIAAVKGLDVIWIGPVDLSQSLGKFGRLDDVDVEAAITRVIERTRLAGKSVGIASGTPEALHRYRGLGVTWFIAQASPLFSSAAARFLEVARA